MFIGPCIIIIVKELETNLMSLVIFITLNICVSVINITSDIKLVSNSSTRQKCLWLEEQIYCKKSNPVALITVYSAIR